MAQLFVGAAESSAMTPFDHEKLGSALECAACIDGLLARKRLTTDVAETGKAILTRIVSMLSKLVASLSAH